MAEPESPPPGPPLDLEEPVDLADPETSRRSLYRLALDLLGRTPTREEAAKLLRLDAAGRVEELRRIGAADLGTFDEVFQRLIGRSIRSNERERLRAQTAGEPAELAELIAASRAYADASHRRPRTKEQRGRALWVDFRDEVPAQRDLETLLRALDDPRAEASSVLRTLLHAGEPRIGPSDLDLQPVPWIRETYARFLLRFPTPSEEEKALAAILLDPDGWKPALLEIALDDAYASY